MAIKELVEFFKEKISEFGGEEGKNYIFRNNTNENSLKDGGAFFGCIHPDEEPSGPFHDFCIVIFPDKDDGVESWLLSLGVGSLGFRNDYELAELPGFRRTFESILSDSGFCKSDFTDLDHKLPKNYEDRISHLSNTLNVYSKVLPVCEILNDPLSNDSKDKITAFIAIYAKARGWLRNKNQRNQYEKALNILRRIDEVNDEEKVFELLTKRRFVILTGAPGTGKTRLAKIMNNRLNAESFFIQFHAETDYSDFIYGIVPTLDVNKLGYSSKFGVFYEAINFAIANKNKKVLLIVDEINRANLSNILGPIFYLFEYRLDANEAFEEIEIGPGLKITKVPDNFYMIGTMNTADRSLAVVDFALRRRFAWYDLKPKPIDKPHFRLEDFNKIQDIFYWYASGSELNLQPGQGYFLADDDKEFKLRIEYELLPLIKEYLQEQLLVSAKEEFNDYFFENINKKLFE